MLELAVLANATPIKKQKTRVILLVAVIVAQMID
jgi:hypothetical protein